MGRSHSFILQFFYRPVSGTIGKLGKTIVSQRGARISVQTQKRVHETTEFFFGFVLRSESRKKFFLEIKKNCFDISAQS